MEFFRALLALLIVCASANAHIVRDSKNETNSSQAGNCLYNGTTFSLGEELPTRGLCLICHCFDGFREPNAFSCNVIDCPWEDYHRRFPGCTPIYADRDCCPIGWECDYGTGQNQELIKVGCDCEWRYLKHYEAKGCRPVYEERPRQKCTCPWRFDCSQTNEVEVDDKVCMYKKHIYPVGSRIPTSNACETCTCGRDYFTQAATIQCTTLECPAVYSQTPLPQGCHYVYKENQCCPTSVECPAAEQQQNIYKVPSCEYRGKMYYEGEQIFPEEDPCLICLCDDKWKGVGGNSSCRQHDCMLERDSRKLKQGCIPIYHEKTCCPIDYHCSDGEEDFKSIKVPSFKLDDDEDEMCYFENRYYPIGHVLDIKHPTNCVTCTCKTPPDFTCIHSSCPPPPNNDYKNCKAVYKPHSCCPDYTCEEKSLGSCPDPICQGTNCWLVKNADGCSVCRCKSRCVPCPPVCRPENPANECSGCICRINDILRLEDSHKEEAQETDSIQQLIQKCKEMQCPANERCMLVEKNCSSGLCLPTSQCEAVSFGCGQPSCPDGCEVIGSYENNCPICKCKDQGPSYKLTCRVQSCEENCILSGRDEHGCPVCKCPQGNLEERVCPHSQCTGYNCTMIIDALGCAACTCQLPCKPRQCPVGCDMDLDLRDNIGLECGCTCKNSSTAATLLQSKSIPDTCPSQSCQGLNCSVFEDKNGCPICECKESCPVPVCQEGCKIETEVSESGRCPGCICKLSRSARDNTGKECPPPTCLGYNCSVITVEGGCQKCMCESPCEESPQCPSHCKLETNVPQGRCRGCVCSYGEHTSTTTVEPTTEVTTIEDDMELEKREDLEADFIPLPGKELVPAVDKIFLIHGEDENGEYAGMPGYHYQGGHAYPVFGEPLESALYNVDDVIPGELESGYVREDEDADYIPEEAEEKTLDEPDDKGKCKQKNCPEGQKCVLRRLQCIRTPCPTIPVCIDVEPRCPIPMCAIGCMVMKWDDEVCPSCFCGIIRGAEGRVCPRTKCAGRRCYNVIGDDGCPQCKCDSICIPPKCQDGCFLEKNAPPGKCPTCICENRSTVVPPIIPGTTPAVVATTIEPTTTINSVEVSKNEEEEEHPKDEDKAILNISELKPQDEKESSPKSQESGYDIGPIVFNGEEDSTGFYNSLADIEESIKSADLTTVTVNLPTTINAYDIFQTTNTEEKQSIGTTTSTERPPFSSADTKVTAKPCLKKPDTIQENDSGKIAGNSGDAIVPSSISPEALDLESNYTDSASSTTLSSNVDFKPVNAFISKDDLSKRPSTDDKSTSSATQMKQPGSGEEAFKNNNMQPILQNLQQLMSNLHQVLSNHQAPNTPEKDILKSSSSIQSLNEDSSIHQSDQKNISSTDEIQAAVTEPPINKPDDYDSEITTKEAQSTTISAYELSSNDSGEENTPVKPIILTDSSIPIGVTAGQSTLNAAPQHEEPHSNQQLINQGIASQFQLYPPFAFQNGQPFSGASSPQSPYQNPYYPVLSSSLHGPLRPLFGTHQQQAFISNPQNLVYPPSQALLQTNIPIPPSLQQQLNAGTQTLGFLQQILSQVNHPFYQQQLLQSQVQPQQFGMNNNYGQWNVQDFQDPDNKEHDKTKPDKSSQEAQSLESQQQSADQQKVQEISHNNASSHSQPLHNIKPQPVLQITDTSSNQEKVIPSETDPIPEFNHHVPQSNNQIQLLHGQTSLPTVAHTGAFKPQQMVGPSAQAPQIPDISTEKNLGNQEQQFVDKSETVQPILSDNSQSVVQSYQENNNGQTDIGSQLQLSQTVGTEANGFYQVNNEDLLTSQSEQQTQDQSSSSQFNLTPSEQQLTNLGLVGSNQYLRPISQFQQHFAQQQQQQLMQNQQQFAEQQKQHLMQNQQQFAEQQHQQFMQNQQQFAEQQKQQLLQNHQVMQNQQHFLQSQPHIQSQQNTQSQQTMLLQQQFQQQQNTLQQQLSQPLQNILNQQQTQQPQNNLPQQHSQQQQHIQLQQNTQPQEQIQTQQSLQSNIQHQHHIQQNTQPQEQIQAQQSLQSNIQHQHHIQPQEIHVQQQYVQPHHETQEQQVNSLPQSLQTQDQYAQPQIHQQYTQSYQPLNQNLQEQQHLLTQQNSASQAIYAPLSPSMPFQHQQTQSLQFGDSPQPSQPLNQNIQTQQYIQPQQQIYKPSNSIVQPQQQYGDKYQIYQSTNQVLIPQQQLQQQYQQNHQSSDKNMLPQPQTDSPHSYPGGQVMQHNEESHLPQQIYVTIQQNSESQQHSSIIPQASYDPSQHQTHQHQSHVTGENVMKVPQQESQFQQINSLTRRPGDAMLPTYPQQQQTLGDPASSQVAFQQQVHLHQTASNQNGPLNSQAVLHQVPSQQQYVHLQQSSVQYVQNKDEISNRLPAREPSTPKPIIQTDYQSISNQAVSSINTKPVLQLETQQVVHQGTSQTHLNEAQHAPAEQEAYEQTYQHHNEQEYIHQHNEQQHIHQHNEQQHIHQHNEQQHIHQHNEQQHIHQHNEQQHIHQHSEHEQVQQHNENEHIQHHISDVSHINEPIQEQVDHNDQDTLQDAVDYQEHVDLEVPQEEQQVDDYQPPHQVSTDERPNDYPENMEHDSPVVLVDQHEETKAPSAKPVHVQSVKTRPGSIVNPHFQQLQTTSSTKHPLMHDLYPAPSRSPSPSLQQQDDLGDPQFEEDETQDFEYEDWDEPEAVTTAPPVYESYVSPNQQLVVENFDNHQPESSNKPFGQQQLLGTTNKYLSNRVSSTRRPVSKFPFSTKATNVFASLSTASPTVDAYGVMKYSTRSPSYQCPTPHCNGYNCSLIRGADGCQKCVCDSPCAPCPSHCVKTKTYSEGRCPVCDCTASVRQCPPLTDCSGSNCREVRDSDGCLSCVCDPKCAEPKCDPGCEVLRDVPPGQCPGCLCRVTVVQAVVKRPVPSCPPVSCIGKNCREVKGPDGCNICSCCAIPKCGPGCSLQTDVPAGQCPSCVCPTFTDDDEDDYDEDLYCPNLFCSDHGCREIKGPKGCPICSCDKPVCQTPNCDPGCEIVTNKYLSYCPVCICSHPYNNDSSSDQANKGGQGIKTGDTSQQAIFTGVVEPVVAEEEPTMSTLHTTVTVDLEDVEETVTIATTTTEAPTCPPPVCSGLRCGMEIGEDGCEICKCRYKCPTPKCVGSCYAETNAPSHRCPGCVCPSKPKRPKY